MSHIHEIFGLYIRYALTTLSIKQINLIKIYFSEKHNTVSTEAMMRMLVAGFLTAETWVRGQANPY